MAILSRFYSLSRDGDSGTQYIGATVVSSSFYSLSRDGDSGTRKANKMSFTPNAGFYSLSRDGDSGTARPRHRGRVRGPVFLFAVARWGQRNRWGRPCPDCPRCVSIRCREMGTAELPRVAVGRPGRLGFYSLSRDGDSGTRRRGTPASAWCFYSLSRDGDSGTVLTRSHERKHHGQFLFAVARWDSGTRP